MNFLRIILRSCLTLILVVSCEPAAAQSLTRTERIEIANTALARFDYATVEIRAQEILNRWPGDEDGLVLMATVHLFGPNPDPSRAQKLLRRLPRKSRSTASIESLNLWNDHRYGGKIFPAVQQTLQIRRSKKLLDQDPFNPIANLVAGNIRLEDLRNLDGAVRFSIDRSRGDGLDGAVISMQPELVGGEVVFVNRRTGKAASHAVSNNQKETEVASEAIAYLLRAAISGPLRKEALRNLSEAIQRAERYETGRIVAEEHIREFPEQVDAYLFLGLALYRQGMREEAGRQFEKAVDLMPEEERLVFLDPKRIASTSVEQEYANLEETMVADFWIRENPLWSTVSNERLIEHQARLVYAELIWGRPKIGRKGRDTEPGRVIIRYGWPMVTAQFQDDENVYVMMHYGSRYWLFLDMAKADEVIFYSPSAPAYQGSRNSGVKQDWVLLAREHFRDDPARTQEDQSHVVAMEALPSVFRNDHSREVIIPVCMPLNRFSTQVRLFVYDREVNAEVPAEARINKLYATSTCTAALVHFETDFRGRQVSIEALGFGATSVYRFDIDEQASDEDFGASDLLLADLVEEIDGAGGVLQPRSFVRRDHLIFPRSHARYNTGDPIYLYFEIYGIDITANDPMAMLSIQAALVPGKRARDITPLLGRIFGRREEAAVSVEFLDEVSEKSHARYLIVETDTVDPGTYVLALKITEQKTGKQVIVSRQIVIE